MTTETTLDTVNTVQPDCTCNITNLNAFE